MMGNFQLQYTAQEELSIIAGQALTESGLITVYPRGKYI
jgi:hypothetical protein